MVKFISLVGSVMYRVEGWVIVNEFCLLIPSKPDSLRSGLFVVLNIYTGSAPVQLLRLVIVE